MDESRFDHVLRTFAAVSGRRAALRLLSAAGMALVAGNGLASGGLTRKKKRKKKKKTCKGDTRKCGKTCIPAANCCSDADCHGGSCVARTCQCLGGMKACNGACVPETHCCENADCDDGNPCTTQICNQDGTCSHPHRPDLSYCGGNNLCSGGVCAAYPGCLDPGMPCVTSNSCCGGLCFVPSGQALGTCITFSDPGEPCHRSEFCLNSTCVGFVCRS
jgi:hypothetical protein